MHRNIFFNDNSVKILRDTFIPCLIVHCDVNYLIDLNNVYFIILRKCVAFCVI